MKEWECVKVGHHKDVAKTIEEYQKKAGVFTHTLVLRQVWERLSIITCCLKRENKRNKTDKEIRFF